MKSMIGRLLCAISLLFAFPMLSACDTVQGANTAVQSATGYSPAQNLYRAHGLYNIALGGFVKYAESSFASPGIVNSGTMLNRQAKPAFEYAEAVIACAGPAAGGGLVVKIANARCNVLDLSPQALNKNASILSNVKNSLLGLLRKGG